MTDYLIDGEILGDIADAIREKTGSDDPITPENMASEIASITVGNKVTDLTDTTWYIPSRWLASAGYGSFEVDFNITAHGGATQNLAMKKLYLGYTLVSPTAVEGGEFLDLQPHDNNMIVSPNTGFVLGREIYNGYALTITFTGGNAVSDTNLINWLYTYGELQVEEPEIDLSAYQTKIDENLTTRSKEIVGAINAVNQSVTDAMSELQLIRDGYTKVGHAETADKLAGQAKLETESKEIVGAINELNEKINVTGGDAIGVDKVKNIDTWYSGVAGRLSADDGISWSEEFAFYGDGGKQIANGGITHRVPIFAGDGIKFELAEDGQYVKINSTGGGFADTYTVSSVAELPKEAVDGSIAFVMGYSIKGEWVFREEIEINVDGAFEVPCIINGYYYIGLFFMDDIIMGGLHNLPDDYSDWYEEGSWYSPRYIKFFADTNDDGFREFIHNNADRLSGGCSLYVRENGIWVYKGEFT